MEIAYDVDGVAGVIHGDCVYGAVVSTMLLELIANGVEGMGSAYG